MRSSPRGLEPKWLRIESCLDDGRGERNGLGTQATVLEPTALGAPVPPHWDLNLRNSPPRTFEQKTRHTFRKPVEFWFGSYSPHRKHYLDYIQKAVLT
eukprot:2476794-Amphidinium_carterae.1